MQVWTMNDIEQTAFKRNYGNRQKPSTVADLRLSVMGASTKHAKHGTRMRIAMDTSLWKFISAGLHDPRINVHGDAAHGLKVFCKDGEGWKPILSKHSTSLIVNATPYKVTGEHVSSMRVEFVQEHEDNGPVIRVPRLPDAFLPDKLLDKLPASQLDPDTLEGRKLKAKEKRMDRASEAFDAAFGLTDAYAAPHGENPVTSEDAAPSYVEPEPAPPTQAVALPTPNALVPEPDEHERTIEDLREAIKMVNELADQIGPAVMLYVDGEGKLKAKRRVVMYTDL
jgi:hypothetical protein